VPARRDRCASGLELRGEVPRRVHRPSQRPRLPVRRRVAVVQRAGTRRTTQIASDGGGARLSQPELATVTIDGREIQVPKGTGLVETAAQAGIEIPVFCYEPRVGAPLGACRMCLCDVEGMPKPMAACTLTATDGMVVRTAQTSAKAAEAQHGVLEFILVNHPLDCPV